MNEIGGPTAKRQKATETYLQYDGNALQYMLVNAVKEQQSQIEELRTENEELRDLINQIATRFSETDATLSLPAGNEGAFLNQNVPNPFKGQTELDYFIPANATSAKIAIFGTGGQLIKSVDIKDQGKGKLTLTASDIPSGNYHYSLILDGQIIDTKTMSIVE